MKNKTILLITLIVTSIGCVPNATQRVGSTTSAANQTINWEAFDDSAIQKNEITVEQLQGERAAYQGVYKFGQYQNAMKLDKPFIIEVKGEVCRRNKESDFEGFELVNNWLISKADTGIINKITDRELTISWKSGTNYTRYYYKKPQ